MTYRKHHDKNVIETSLRGGDLLRTPMLNKGTAFSNKERKSLDLEGLLPGHVSTIDQQCKRAYANVTCKESRIERYVALADVQDRNEHLFYHLLLHNLEEFLPIVYTPTVGEAVQRYSHLFRRPRGVWITPEHKGQMKNILSSLRRPEIDLIVVTDNERILGLGDQGAGGIAISIGKLSLYSVGAGIHPERTLPVSLDVGTDNEELLRDPLYLGYPKERLRGAAYLELVEEFVCAVKHCFPTALLQWEDFKKNNAFDLLEKYRHRLLCFNDDIQGTAAVVLATLMGAFRILKSNLDQHRILILGAGAAGIGISQLLRRELYSLGIKKEEVGQYIALMDSRGLLVKTGRSIEAYKKEFAWDEALVQRFKLTDSQMKSLPEMVKAFKPTVLIGTSGEPGVFTQEVVQAMAESTPRPVICPLSNPTANSEAIPEDLFRWTQGRALIATGSPFDPVHFEGKTYKIAQANNVYVFPGLGLGALVGKTSQVTDDMFLAAAKRLSMLLSSEETSQGMLLPPLGKIREISKEVAQAVVEKAREENVGCPMCNEDIAKTVTQNMWFPMYPEIWQMPC